MKRALTTIAGLTMLIVPISSCADFGGAAYKSPGSSASVPPGYDRDASAPTGKRTGTDGMTGGMEMPFGTNADTIYAAKIWTAMQSDDFVGPDSIITNPYQGNEPHGEILEIITSDAVIDGHHGTLIVKKNYFGDSITSLDVANNPDAYLDSVTIMFQRRPGYDSDNADWFWAKYGPDGTVMTNPMDMALAGRIAKGMDTGCIACHVAAPGGDLVFSHDRLSEEVAEY